MRIWLLGLLLLIGCAHPKKSFLAIPQKCISEIRPTDKTKCESVSDHPDYAVCNGVIVRFNCVEPAKNPTPKPPPHRTELMNKKSTYNAPPASAPDDNDEDDAQPAPAPLKPKPGTKKKKGQPR